MNSLRSKTTAIIAGALAFIGLQAYGYISMRNTLEDRMSSIEQELQTTRSQGNKGLTQLTSDLNTVTDRMGITAQELQKARTVAEQLRREHARTAQRLRAELAAKADSKAVSEFREEATTKLAEVQNEASTKIGAVSGEVQTVRTDLNSTRSDLDATRQDLASSRRDITDVKGLVARNSTELSELRRRGERDYVEFDIRKGKQFDRIGDIQVQLKKTDIKRQKYDVVINADDNRLEKKDRVANEPLQFLVGRDRLRYEFVVNYVDKDRIRGYVSTPKDKVLSAEGPRL